MSEDNKGSSGVKYIIMVLVVAGIGIFIFRGFMSFNQPRELSRRAMCAINLNGIGKAIILYSASNDDICAIDYDQLVSGGYASKKMFICPSYSKSMGGSETFNRPDYVMLIAGLSARSSDIQVFELPVNHSQKQVNYLTCSGGVASIKNPDMHKFATAIQDVNNLLGKLRNNPEVK